jgi:hypothetical protein
MTIDARHVLDAYDALAAEDRQQVAVEILRRASSSNELTNEAFEQTATDIFRAYDAEEAAASGG